MTVRVLTWIAVSLLVGATLAGCGRKGDLEPPPERGTEERRAPQTDDG